MKKTRKVLVNRAAWVLFVVYIAALAYFLFFSEYYGRKVDYHYSFNLELFKEIKRFIVYREVIGITNVVVNILGNVFAFVPFGFILPIISPKNGRFLNVLLLSIELTLTIEVLQFLLKVGIFDVDDIFLNTMGGIIGYVFFVICTKLVKGKKR